MKTKLAFAMLLAGSSLFAELTFQSALALAGTDTPLHRRWPHMRRLARVLDTPGSMATGIKPDLGDFGRVSGKGPG